MRERDERIKQAALADARLRRWYTSRGPRAESTARPQAGEPGPEARRRVAEGLTAAGRRLGSDPRLLRPCAQPRSNQVDKTGTQK